MVGKTGKKLTLGLIVPIGLLNGTSTAADRTVCTAGSIGADLARRQILLLENLDCLEIWKFCVARVFKQQGFGTVADDNPLTTTYQQFGHWHLQNGRRL